MFFFKQHTAYEVRISDWSSDVCSSDLEGGLRRDRDGSPTVEIGDEGVEHSAFLHELEPEGPAQLQVVSRGRSERAHRVTTGQGPARDANATLSTFAYDEVVRGTCWRSTWATSDRVPPRRSISVAAVWRSRVAPPPGTPADATRSRSG